MDPEQPWLIQVYRMTDQAAQASATQLLASAGRCVVDARSCERGSFLIVEVRNAGDALAVYELVMMADHDAELIYSTGKPSDSSPDTMAVVSA